MAADPNVAVLSGDPILNEAKKRWDRCQEWESNFRRRFIEDVQFANADSDNGYQWPSALRAARDVSQKPCLTLNIIRQHNLMISNELRKNKSSVKVVGTGNGATAESAGMFRDVIRRIEYISRAQSHYSVSRKWQIDGGIGWIRILTDYSDDDSMDQEIYVQSVLDPLSVYIDPDCLQHDCSDAKFAFVFDDMYPEELDSLYPEYKGTWAQNPMGIGPVSLDATEKVKICEYFRRVDKKDKLVSFVGVGGKRHTMRHSKLQLLKGHKEILSDPHTRTREIADTQVEWKLIIGDTIVDETVWLGKYIPLVPFKGEEIVISGRLDRKGHTRNMKDAQRMFNYNASAQVEFQALQGKTPWTGAVDAIEELEEMWASANTKNHSYLAFKHKDQDGEPIPPEALPRRIDPPNASPAYQSGMDTAFNQMMMVSGQWQNQMGMQGNERTGAAINARQKQGDTATFHFQDNYEESLQSIGRQLIDLIPKVYDTQRVIKIVADDGTEMDVEIDPGARQAYFQEVSHRGEVVRRVFNPNVGKYDVAASVGPAYGTKREETAEALTLILTQNPGLTGLVGDLLLSSLDFEAAQEAAKRLKRMVPPVALGQGPTQAEQQLQQQVQSLQAALSEALHKQAKDQLKLVGKDQMRDIDVYKAETDRMKALADQLPMDPQGLQKVIEDLVQQSLQTTLEPILSANSKGVAEQSESGEVGEGEAQPTAGPVVGSTAHPSAVPGARQAPDGEWYISDPTRKGRYLHIAPLAQLRKKSNVEQGL